MSIILKQTLKILLLILISNLFFFYNLNLLANEEKNCLSYNQNKKNVYPKFIEIQIPNSGKWVRRVLKSIQSPRIPKELKKYQKAKILVTYPNQVKCNYLGEIRIHGSTNIHVKDPDLFTSVRIKLLNGNINKVSNFSLIKKNARRFDDEIFMSQIFEEFGYLSPLNFKTRVSLNNKEIFKEYLFIEEPNFETLKNRNRNNGLIVSGNRNNRLEKKLSDTAHRLVKSERSITLNRIKDYQGISIKNKNNLLYALDKINYIYLNSLGIGDGLNCCDYFNNETQKTFIEKNYNSNVFYLNFKKLKGDKNFDKLIIYKLLMLASNSQHGLMLEDMSFYYDPTFDSFEPIYRDGDPDIVSNQNILNKAKTVIFKFEKEQIDKVITILNQINIRKIQKEITSKGLNLEIEQIKIILEKISNNLLILKNFKSYEFDSKLAQNYFFNHFDKKMKLNLIFGGLNNKFEICDVSLKNCQFRKFSDNEFYHLLDKKFVSIDGFKNKSLYVRLSKEDYIKNLKPLNRSIIDEYTNIKLEKNLHIFTNAKDSIKVNKTVKEVTLFQKNEKTQFVIKGNSEKSWTINFLGINFDEKIDYKRNEKMLGGCINIINSTLKNLKLNLKNALCPKAIEILNSNVHISNAKIENSASDAFDAEFSKINFDKIEIKKTRGECIGLKRGEYLILSANLEECGDKALSGGEYSEIKANQLDIEKSYTGVFAKNNSRITVENLESKENFYCIWSNNSSSTYNGSLIEVKKDKTNCNDGKIRQDINSRINYY